MHKLTGGWLQMIITPKITDIIQIIIWNLQFQKFCTDLHIRTTQSAYNINTSSNMREHFWN